MVKGCGVGWWLPPSIQSASKKMCSSRLDVVGVTSLGQGGRFPLTRFVFDLLAAPFCPNRLKTENASKTTRLLGWKEAVAAFQGQKGSWETSYLVFQPRCMVFLELATQFHPKCLAGVFLCFSPHSGWFPCSKRSRSVKTGWPVACIWSIC